MEKKRITIHKFADYYIEGKIIKPENFFPISHFRDSSRDKLKQLGKTAFEIKRNVKIDIIEKLKLRSEIKERIYDALQELTKCMLAIKLPRLKMSNKEIVNQRRKTIKHLEKSLEYPFLKRKAVIVIQEELNALKEFDKKKKTYTDMQELVFTSKMVKENELKNISTTDLIEKDKINIELVNMMSTPLDKKEGRPKKFFYKALQIIIYKLLTEQAQIPKEKAKTFTAQIINEYHTQIGVSDLSPDLFPALKYKDIDNAVH